MPDRIASCQSRRRGKERHDLGDERLGVAADQRRGEAPRELDGLDIRESGGMDARASPRSTHVWPRNENGARGGISAAAAARIHALDEQNRSIAGVCATS